MTESELWLLFAAAAVAGGQHIPHAEEDYTTTQFPGVHQFATPTPDPAGVALFADQMVIQYRKRFGYDEDTPDGEEETGHEG